jgi:hypothetical protein
VLAVVLLVLLDVLLLLEVELPEELEELDVVNGVDEVGLEVEESIDELELDVVLAVVDEELEPIEVTNVDEDDDEKEDVLLPVDVGLDVEDEPEELVVEIEVGLEDEEVELEVGEDVALPVELVEERLAESIYKSKALLPPHISVGVPVHASVHAFDETNEVWKELPQKHSS